MLKFHFINVGDGDAILIQYSQNSTTLNFLIDTGRGDLTTQEGSKKLLASEYLKKHGITDISHFIITHLHIDHVGDIERITDNSRIGKLYCSFLPQDPTARALPEQDTEDTVGRATAILNTFSDILAKTAKTGTIAQQILEDSVVFDDGKLKITLLTADRQRVDEQNRIYNAILERKDMSFDQKYWAAKIKNANSLRVIMEYAGRRIELDGDYNAPEWETQKVLPCDILKVPHHADNKSITPTIAQRLRPQYAVISCQKDHMQRKDRPSKSVADMLRANGAKVYYTDSFHEQDHTPYDWEAVIISVDESGNIVAPKEQ